MKRKLNQNIWNHHKSKLKHPKGGVKLASVVDHEKHYTNTDVKLHKEMEELEKQRDSCTGRKNIMRYKSLVRKITEIKKAIFDLKQTKETLCDFQNTIQQLPHKEKTNNSKPHSCRLYPPEISMSRDFEHLHTERDIDKWKLTRSFKKRCSLLMNTDNECSGLRNNIDKCDICGVDTHVDKESAKKVCPMCGTSSVFFSHIFESKDMEKDDSETTRQQSLAHMHKFGIQYEKGYPTANVEVLENLTNAYNKFHFHTPSKVQSCRTNKLLRQCKNIPKFYRRCPDRLSKELKSESIPEWTSDELSHLLNQRNKLPLPADKNEYTREEKKNNPKKSFNNCHFVRAFSRASGWEQARLIPNAKTTKIYFERNRDLERQISQIEQNKHSSKTDEIDSEYCFQLFPHT
jgi:hypothetical protein